MQYSLYLTYARTPFRINIWGSAVTEGVCAMEHLDTVIEKLSGDQAFRTKYCQDPDTALAGYLNPEEIRAVKTGDGHRIAGLGSGEKWEQLTQALCGHDPGP
jgi:hypothetical protein